MRRVMTQVETVRMSEFMKQVIVTLPTSEGEASLCEYKEGWDDTKVAKEIAPDLTAVHSGGLRKNLYGNLYIKTDIDQLKRIVVLEDKLRDTLILLDDFIERYNKLCTGLSLARVGVETKHLAVPKNGGK